MQVAEKKSHAGYLSGNDPLLYEVREKLQKSRALRDTIFINLITVALGHPTRSVGKLLLHVGSRGKLYPSLAEGVLSPPTKIPSEKTEIVLEGFKTHPLFSHPVFATEGEVFSNLRIAGAYSLGELQQLLKTLITDGIYRDENSGEIEIDQDILELWTKIVALSRTNHEQSDEDFFANEQVAIDEAQSFARSKVAFNGLTKLFESTAGKKLIEKFLTTKDAVTAITEFKDYYFAAQVQSNEQIAQALLTNYCLTQFEFLDHGNTDSHFANEQFWLENQDVYEVCAEFFDGLSTQENLPELQQILSADSDSTKIFEILSLEFTQNSRDLSAEKKSEIMHKVRHCLIKAAAEMRRHRDGHALVKKLFPRITMYADLSVMRNLVAKMGLVSTEVLDENDEPMSQFTIASWLPNTGYYPNSREKRLPKLVQQEKKVDTVEGSIKEIFSQKSADIQTKKERAQAYEQQVDSIRSRGYEILEFLQSDAVPDEIKRYAQLITSDSLAEQLIKNVIASLDDGDPMIVNRFTKRFSDFQTMLQHRLVQDFVRGVETRLIYSTLSLSEKIKRRFEPVWKLFDFSDVKDEVISNAVADSLRDGAVRMRSLDKQKQAGDPMLFKEFQESIETFFGWDMYDMMFLRHKHAWTSLSYMGVWWDCICWSRKTIFNTKVFPQY
ncbi:MAG: hypothetical protein WAU07_05490 [Microgenomates group bacterium]